MANEELSEATKKAREDDALVGVTAHEICLLLEERRFTFYGANAVLERVEYELGKVKNRQLVKAAEYAMTRYGEKIAGSPLEEEKSDDPAEN